MKWLRRLVIAVNVCAAVALLAIGAGAWLLSSERGTAWLIGALLERAGTGVSVARIEGTLLDGLKLGDVRLNIGGDLVEVEEVELTVAFGAALVGTLGIDELRTSMIRYMRRPAAGRAGGGVLPTLPFVVDVRRAVLAGVAIESDQDSLVFDVTSLTARYADGALAVGEIATSVRGVRLAGRAEVAGGAPLSVVVAVDWLVPRQPEPLTGSLELAGTLPELDIRHELTAPFALTAGGKVWLEATPRIEVELKWTDLAMPGREELRSAAGTAAVFGAITALEFSSSGALHAYGQEFDYTAAGSVEGAVLVLEPLTLVGIGGTLTANGEIALDSLQWELALEGRALRPGAYDARFPGRIDAQARLSGRVRPQPQVRVEALEVSGELHEYPFAATAAGVFGYPQSFRIDAFDIVAGSDRLRATGRIEDTVDVTVDASVEQLARWWPELSGAARGDLRVTGTFARPQLEGTVTARAAEFRGYGVEALELTGSAAAHLDGAIDLDLRASGIRRGPLLVAGARAVIGGSLVAHDVNLSLDAEQWSSMLGVRGGVAGARWQGSIESARVSQTLLGEWRLTEPAALELARDRAILGSTCLVQNGANVCGALRLTGGADDEIAVSARNFDLQALEPFFPETLRVRGVYQLSASISNPGDDPRGYVALAGGPTQLRVVLSEQDSFDSEIRSVAVHGNLTGGQLDLRAVLDGGDVGRVDLEARLADVRDQRSGVDGQVEMRWDDLGALSLLSPTLGTVAGNATLQLEFGGTLAAPELSGRAQWSDGSVEVPNWGLSIEQIESTAVTVDGTSLEYTGVGLVDGQALRVQGSTELDPARNWPTRLSLDGESLQLVRRADAEVLVSPDLEVEVALPNVTVAGTVHVPSATIALEELPAQAVRPSADSVVHGVTTTAPVRPLRTRADIRVTLGDDVHYNGSNLTTDLSGELRLQYESGRTPDASGSLSLAGTYDAYGQSLQLERGELLFTGPLDDPALDVRAERKIEETTVGVQLLGTLKAPVTRIYSDPAMSEADALAYLLLGRPLSGTGEQETATLESAALAMGLQQALPVVQRIGNTLGLDELSIQTTDVDAGALMAGKYLSPKLYVRYSYGLFNRIGGLLVRFRFNERLSIETRSGDEKSMDLLYTVEKE